jgi:hypothetical protein
MWISWYRCLGIGLLLSRFVTFKSCVRKEATMGHDWYRRRHNIGILSSFSAIWTDIIYYLHQSIHANDKLYEYHLPNPSLLIIHDDFLYKFCS